MGGNFAFTSLCPIRNIFMSLLQNSAGEQKEAARGLDHLTSVRSSWSTTDLQSRVNRGGLKRARETDWRAALRERTVSTNMKAKRDNREEDFALADRRRRRHDRLFVLSLPVGDVPERHSGRGADHREGEAALIGVLVSFFFQRERLGFTSRSARAQKSNQRTKSHVTVRT